MAYQENLIDSEMIKDSNEIADYVVRCIGGGRRRHIGVAEAAEVRGYGSEALGSEKEKLVAP